MPHKPNLDIEDRDWWRRVAELIGMTLYGWSYRKTASFTDDQHPPCRPLEMDSKVAAMLLEQQSEIESLERQITEMAVRLENFRKGR